MLSFRCVTLRRRSVWVTKSVSVCGRAILSEYCYFPELTVDGGDFPKRICKIQYRASKSCAECVKGISYQIQAVINAFAWRGHCTNALFACITAAVSFRPATGVAMACNRILTRNHIDSLPSGFFEGMESLRKL